MLIIVIVEVKCAYHKTSFNKKKIFIDVQIIITYQYITKTDKLETLFQYF